MINEKQTKYDESSTIDDEIDRHIKAVGRKLGPTYQPGRTVTHNRVEAFNERSRKALERINKKYGRPGIKKPLYVDSKLRVHD
jgi:hypothetical protein